ncbi:MAG: toll/interleukin-1 receptor domain-containing protein, partial [Anaerolineae bacterium]|nr:toll/interleukin-1 receptor domain-containing protein [Anaerolineae bacterium]
MPLDRDQFKACIEMLLPFVDTVPEDRRALVDRALHGSPVMSSIDWTGNPRTFATNLVRQLERFDDVTSLIMLLETLRDEVGEPKKSAITALITSLAPPPPRRDAPTPAAGTDEVVSYSRHVFISYSRKDTEFAEKLERDLNARGFTTWRDTSSIVGGEAWYQAIMRGIQQSFAMLQVVTSHSEDSKWVRREGLYADQRDLPIIPVLPEPHPIPFHLIETQPIAFDNYAAGFARLIAALRLLADAAPAADPAAAADPRELEI